MRSSRQWEFIGLTRVIRRALVPFVLDLDHQIVRFVCACAVDDDAALDIADRAAAKLGHQTLMAPVECRGDARGRRHRHQHPERETDESASEGHHDA